ncbi:hypothetical protein BHMPCIPO_01863 [Ensifer sesbaniae]|jgi:hypothetical protein|nr:hypothetical protein [Ensifer sesbaniae]
MNRLLMPCAVRQALSAVGAADHPRTATGLMLTVGFRALTIGYVMGRSSAVTGQGYRR